MRRSVFHGGALDELARRLGALEPDSRPRWGRLDAPGLLRHLRRSLELAYPHPQRTRPRKAPHRTLMAWVFLGPVPFPKGAPTPDWLTPDGDPADFEAQREALLGELDALVENGPLPLTGVHPIFGPLNGKQWGRLTYKHFDHHLRQFGV